MGIPLPALDIKTPDILGQYAKVVAIKGAMQNQAAQQAMMPGELQGQQLENQQKQMAVQSQQAMMQAAKDPSVQWDQPGAYDRYLQSARQAGANPQSLLQLQTGIIDMKQKMAATDKDTLQNQIIQNDTRRGKLLSIVQEKDPQAKQTAWDQEITNEEKAGTIQPGQFPHQYPGDDPATLLANHFAQGSVLAKEAIDRQVGQARLAQALKPTKDSLAAAASGGDAAAQKALDLLNQMDISKAGAEENARVTAQNSPAAIQGAANKAAAVESAKGPAMAANAAGTEVAKAQALAPKLDEITQTMTSGRKYVDLSKLTGPQRSLIQQQAAEAGIPTVDSKTASLLSDLDTARMNQKYMLDTISKKLPAGPVARFYQAPENTLAKLSQSDPALAAIGTYRSAAIQSMRAVAGSQGLRINKAEIQLAIDNDIPKMTDTLPTAQAKLRNMQTFFDNAESAHLTQNRQTGATAQPAGQQQGGGWGAKFGGKQIQGVQQ